MNLEVTRMIRMITAVVGVASVVGGVSVVGGCGSHSQPPPAGTDQHVQHVQRKGPGPGAPSGYWDADGRPINGGPPGADGSTGNNLGERYCARNDTPACPIGSYVGPDASGR